ncbi:MAG: hypothetical protein HY303_08875 [Candidatus Wallbacteria bacterium]|nr:hypothetical protein [Candidatus Wallbacteria bacterium]
MLDSVWCVFLLLTALGAGGGCGPDDLPNGVLPGALVSYQPTSTTSGTTTTTSPSLSIRQFTPTSPTAETTVTIAGTGFGTSAAALGFVYIAAATSRLQGEALGATVPTVVLVGPVATATGTSVTVPLPVDLVSGGVRVGVRASTASTSITKVSNQLLLNVLPRVVSYVGSRTARTPFSLEAGGVSIFRFANAVKFLDSAGRDVGTTIPIVDFQIGRRAIVRASVPDSVALTPAVGVQLQVAGVRSAPFPLP